MTKKQNPFCTVFILQSFWFHFHDLQNQNCLLVTLQNDNHSPGPGRLVPSSHQRTILGTFSKGDKRVWKCIPIPNGLWGKATVIKISSILTYVSEHHERQTRSTVIYLLHIPRSHSAYFDRAFSVQGPKLWNSLPADIRNSTSINRFKCQLKRYLLYNN